MTEGHPHPGDSPRPDRLERRQPHPGPHRHRARRRRANGRRERLALALGDDELQAIYSSDLTRARQTAAPLAARNELQARVDPGLRERGFGEFEGLSFKQIEQRWPDQAEAWRRRDPDFGARGGEVLRDFRDRVVAAVTRLARAHRGQSIALVTHGGVLDLLYREATRVALDAPRTWQLANASINRLLHSGEGLVLVGWADVGHLDRHTTARR